MKPSHVQKKIRESAKKRELTKAKTQARNQVDQAIFIRHSGLVKKVGFNTFRWFVEPIFPRDKVKDRVYEIIIEFHHGWLTRQEAKERLEKAFGDIRTI